MTHDELSMRFGQLREYVDSAVAAPDPAKLIARNSLDSAPRLLAGRRWGRVVLPVLAAAVIVAVALSVALSTHQSTSRPVAPAVSTPVTEPALTCPEAAPIAISQKDLYPLPSPGPNPLTVTDRLLPASTPVHAVVCGYVRRQDTTVPTIVASSRIVDAGLANIAATLAFEPPDTPASACSSDIKAHDFDSYLLGVTYPTGTMWISAPGNHCLGASNGHFVTDDHVATSVMTALANGAWPDPKPATTDACQPGSGRLGQESAMVPDTPLSLVVCRDSDAIATTAATPAQLAAIAAALNRLPVAPESASQCGNLGRPSTAYTLTFQYRVGPSVTVNVDAGCTPAVHNGNLSATDAGTVLPELQQILNH